MSASYTIMEYVGPMLLVGVGGFLLNLIFGVLLAVKLGRRFKNNALIYLFVLVPASVVIFLGIILTPALNHIGDLMIPSEYVIRTTAGEIKAISHADLNMYHYRNGALRTGQKVVVEDTSFYVISDDALAEGMCIELQYAHFENNVILNWHEVTPERATQIRLESLLTDSQTPAVETKPEISPKMEHVGAWLTTLGFFGFVAMVGLTTFFRYKIAAKLLRREASLKGEIKANKAAILCQILPFLCFLLIITGIIIQEQDQFLVIFVIGLGVIGWFVGLDATTKLKLDGSTFTIRRLGRERTYQMADVYSVFWRNNRGIIGKTMVIVLNSGKTYWFSMDSYSGVEYVYSYISGYLENMRK